MTLPRLHQINLYQQTHPPVHIMIAAYLGIGKTDEKTTDPDGPSLCDLFPQRQ